MRSPNCSALERDEVRDLLRDGQSSADIATAQGVDVQTVIDTLVNVAKEHLDEAVANGRLTQEEADAKLPSSPSASPRWSTRPALPPTTDPVHRPGRPHHSTPETFRPPRTESSPRRRRPRSPEPGWVGVVGCYPWASPVAWFA